MAAKFTNNASGALSAGITAVATTVPLVVGQGALFPAPAGSDYFYLTIVRASDSAREIVKCTARAGDSLTVVRAQESTTGLIFATADKVSLRLTAAGIDSKFDKVGGVISGDTTVTGTAHVTGVSLLDGAVTLGSTLGVTGAATIGGTLGVTTDLTVGGKSTADLYLTTRNIPAAAVMDLAASDHFTKTVVANTVWTVINIPASGLAMGFTLKLTQGSAYTHTWPVGTIWVNGVSPTFPAGTHLITFFTDDGGSTYLAAAARSFA